MVYSQAPIPFSRGNAKPRVFLHNIVPDTLEPSPEDSRTALVFDALRHQIAGGARIEDILESAASAAQDLTAASGAAIAMGRDSTVLCVGRSGETAPPLGAQVSVESGISGECIRSGKSVICDDTQLDPRVDADLCLSLGLRSLAAVPLRAVPGEMVGLLEVFSNYPANFLREHIHILQGLGELVELAHSRVTKAAVPEPSPEEQVATQVTTAVDESLAEPRTIDWLRDSQEQAGERKFPYWVIPIALIVVLLSFRGWVAWHEPAKISVAPPESTTEELTIASPVVAKPAPSRNRQRQKPSIAETPTPETAEVVVRNFGAESSPGRASETPQTAREESSEPPQLPVLSSNPAVLTNLVANQTTMPRAAMKVSQGVVRGSVIHRVPPTYPKEALAQGWSGPVELRATIDEHGAVREVEAVSGPPVLSRAAVDAVKQWRYEPSLLNGTPVQVETEITVNFKKP
jgi:TonB family protein